MRTVGSYVLLGELAAGGMASVHLGKLSGPAGFSRTVAIKRLHPQFAKDPEFVSMFLDEARFAARIRHPNVVAMLDVVAADTELFLVMDYIEGESLARLLKRCRKSSKIPLPIVSAILSNVLRGLHAAHEVKGEMGEPLELVHRDASPHNILVGTDGVARLADFGIAKAVGRLQTTREGRVKGKLPYMAPEQIRGLKLTRRTDVYALGVVLWECLAVDRLFHGDEGHVLERILLGTIPAPSTRDPSIPASLDKVVARATARDPEERFETALEMAVALEHAVRPALAPEVSAWMEALAGPSLKLRAARVMEELGKNGDVAPASATTPDTREAPDTSASESKPIITPTGTSIASASIDEADGPGASSADERTPAPAPDPPPETARDPKRDRFTRIALAIVAIGAVTGGIVALVTNMRTGAPNAGAAASASSTGSVVAAAAPVPPVADASAVVDLEVAAPPPTQAAPPTQAVTPPPTPSATGKPRGRVTKPPPKGVDCTIPYVLDATGKRIYRRECLGKR